MDEEAEMTAPIDHLDASASETVRRHAATFRSVREARAAAPSDESAAWPEAEVAARDARPEEVPPPARKLADLAAANGWQTRVVFSRGTSQSGRADNPERGPVVEAVSVRCRRGTQRCVGYWRAPVPRPPMKWRAAWAFGLAQGELTPRLVGARELTAMVAEPPSDAL